MRTVRWRGKRNASRREKRVEGRQAARENKQADHHITEFAERQVNLVEQQEEEADGKDQGQRTKQDQEILGIDFRRIGREVGAAKGLGTDEDSEGKKQKIAQARGAEIGKP